MFKTRIYATQSILKTSKRKTSHVSICIYVFLMNRRKTKAFLEPQTSLQTGDEQEKDKSLSGATDVSPDWR